MHDTKTLAELARTLISRDDDLGDHPRNRLNDALRNFSLDRPHAPVNRGVLSDMLNTFAEMSDLNLSLADAATIALIVEFAATLTPETVKEFRM